MPAPIYADPAAWLAWSGQADAPADFVQLLRTASRKVRNATALWRYQADPVTWLPTDTSLLQAMSDATCAQISAMIALEVDPDAGSTLDGAVEASVGLGSARITYQGSEAVAEARRATIEGLCPDSLQILRDASQLSAVWMFG